jgi:hypothetical protein
MLCDYVQNGEEMARAIGITEGAYPVRHGQLPTRINKGRIVHNEVEHSVNTTCGRNGFNAVLEFDTLDDLWQLVFSL